MKRSTRVVRDAGALVAIIALVGMIFLEFWYPRLDVSEQAYSLLLLLISALLGIDILRERYEVIIAMVIGALEGYLDYMDQGSEGDDDD